MVAHRFRPAQSAVDADGSVQRESYFWLAYDWQNLYPACPACADAHGAQFPVGTTRAPTRAVGDALAQEKPWLLDPCEDEVEEHFVYLDSGEVAPSTEKGRMTIDVFGLNRSDLVAARNDAIDGIAAELDQALRAVGRQDSRIVYERFSTALNTSLPFAGLRRQYAFQRMHYRRAQLRALLGEEYERMTTGLRVVTDRLKVEAEQDLKNNLGRAQSPKLAHSSPRPNSIEPHRIADARESYWTRVPAVRAIHIENFRGIDHLDLNFETTSGAGGWTIILGENGVGKTSLLQAIALSMAGGIGTSQLALRTKDLLKNGTEAGYVEVELDGISKHIGFEMRRGRQIRYLNESELPIAAYGATRLLSRKVSRQPKFLSANVANLFDPFTAIARTELWVPELSEEQFDEVASALLRLLDVSNEDAYLRRTRAGRLQLVNRAGAVDLDQLSSGFQSVSAMALDLIRVFITRWGSLDAAEGIVLIDEIEAHLHPRWQMRVISSLRQAFPRVQFIATTHSPLCLRGTKDREIVVLNEGGSVIGQEDLPSIKGLSVDGILTSESFGMNSTIDATLEQRYSRYYALLANRDRSAKEEAQLVEVRDDLASSRQFGQNQRERLLLEATDAFLAARKHQPQAKMPSTEELKRHLQKLWES